MERSAKTQQGVEAETGHVVRGLDTSKTRVHRNLTPDLLYEHALDEEPDTVVASCGALAAYSGAKTGRSPRDKRIVQHPDSQANVWWGGASPNVPLSADSFASNRKVATDFLAAQEHLYVVDGFVNWGAEARLTVRVVCTRPYHALFMRNMMIRPAPGEASGSPDFVILNAGVCTADTTVPGITSTTSVAINLEAGEMVILGTEYAGEMKKGIFSVCHYLMPLRGALSLHSGCNVGAAGDVTLFFGLSGTGKTTLSADPKRPLIGDDEHVWGAEGVFNIEGGCYAKCINLSREKEPDIWNAIRFGAVLENCVLDAGHTVDFDDTSITENTRASYPIEAIANARVPCVGGHPKNIILLCCDAFGVLPPVARLTPAQAMYHFISGYTAKVAGTEVGVTEPAATFSACFGGAFLAWHPMKYAAMLSERIAAHGATAWLVNTGWSGGAYGVGKRMALRHTRALVDGIHSGALSAGEFSRMPVFGLDVPTACPGIPAALLQPRGTWADGEAYDAALLRLAGLFRDNMAQYASEAGTYVAADIVAEVLAAGPAAPPPSSTESVASDDDVLAVPLAAGSGCAIAASASAGRLDRVASRSGLA